MAGESTIDNIAKERDYKKNNVNVTKNILDAAKHFGIAKIIFSSTAAVYKSTDIEINENSEYILKKNNLMLYPFSSLQDYLDLKLINTQRKD